MDLLIAGCEIIISDIITLMLQISTDKMYLYSFFAIFLGLILIYAFQKNILIRLKKAEKAYHLSEDKYHAVFMSVTEGMLIIDAADAKIMDANRAASALMKVLFHGQDVLSALPADIPAGFPVNTEDEKRKKWCPEPDNANFCIEMERVAIGESLFALTMTDISEAKTVEKLLLKDKNELKRAVKRSKDELVSLNEKLVIKLWQLEEYEKQLKLSEQRFKILSNASHEAVMLIEEGNVLDVNRSFLELSGYTQEEVLGKAAGDFIPDDVLEATAGEAVLEKKDGLTYPAKFEIKREGLQNSRRQILVISDLSERKQVEGALKAMAFLDELTGLYNRRGFIAFGNQLISQAQRAKKVLALVYFDMDGLKTINDNYGHIKGDKALKEFAYILKDRTFRKSDIIARIGGDEFVVLAMEARDEEMNNMFRRLRKIMDSFNEGSDEEYRISVSSGVARKRPGDRISIYDLINMADKSMYEDKKKKSY